MEESKVLKALIENTAGAMIYGDFALEPQVKSFET